MRNSEVAWFLAVAFTFALPQFPSREALEKADIAIRRRNPSDFPQLPEPLLRDLQRRGDYCRVPQVDLQPHNVIEGHFRTANETDWAILCSRDRISVIRVYWGADPNDSVELASDPDANNLEPTVIVLGDGVSHSLGGSFGRRITMVSAELIRQHLVGTSALSITHDGIADTFAGRPGYVWYQHDGQWLRFGPFQIAQD